MGLCVRILFLDKAYKIRKARVQSTDPETDARGGEAGNLHSKREVPGRKYAIGFLGASKSGMPVYAEYNPFEFHIQFQNKTVVIF